MPVKINHLWLAFICFCSINPALADTPATSASLMTAPVPVGGSYPYVSPGGERWFDEGGFCKVVDATAAANETPVFIPGDASQWENWRQSEFARPTPGITVATCCRPQANIARLCTEAGAAVVEVSRQYGKVGEVDTVSATCTDMWGRQYQDQVNVQCGVAGGGADGPDAQGAWLETGADSTSACTPNAFTSGCSASCPQTVGTTTTYDSCGNVQSVNSCSISCCTTDYQKSCNGSTATYTDYGTCRGGSFNVTNGCSEVSYSCSASCTLGDANSIYDAGSGCTVTYYDCSQQGNWGPPPGSTGCSHNEVLENTSTTGCKDPSQDRLGSAGPVITSFTGCTCYEYE